MAATEHLSHMLSRLCTLVVRAGGLLVGAIASLAPTAATRAADLPADQAEALLHAYKGGGVTATGPAFLVRKSLANKVSLSGLYYVDAVSNASIDVVTTASAFKETRNAYDVGLDYVVRDTGIRVARSTSREPDYTADALSVDITQDLFANMTTASLGYTRGWDRVGKSREGFFDRAQHWQYRLGLSQVLTARLTASVNFEAIADDGYLGNPYRVARVFGAAVPERHPRTRSSRSVAVRSAYSLGAGSALRGEVRHFWDTWGIRANTFEIAWARAFGDTLLAEGFARLHTQGSALFYSDNAADETLYLSRNRQLSSFTSPSFGAKATYTMREAVRGQDLRFTGSIEFKQFKYDNFTDIRTGQAYSHNAALLQLTVSANF